MTIICDIETEGLEARYDRNCLVKLVGLLELETGICTMTSIRKLPTYLEKYKEHEWVFHNAKFDLAVMYTHLESQYHHYLDKMLVHDTQVLAYCLDTSLISYSLDNLSAQFLGEKKVVVKDFRTADTQLLVARNQKDLQLTAALFELFNQRLLLDDVSYDQYLNVEIPYMKLLVQMERKGIAINLPEITQYEKSLKRYLSWLDKKRTNLFYSFATGTAKYQKNSETEYLPITKKWATLYYSNVKGEKLYARTELDVWNVGSPEQNARVLTRLYPSYNFNLRSTKTGKMTVNSTELASFDVPLSTVIRKSVDAEQKVTSFTEPIIRLNRDGVVYAEFNQTVTRTGRLSSSNPNLQNIPRKGRHGAKFRSLFIARPGYSLVVGDLDRIEIVVLSHYLETLGFSSYMAEAIRNKVNVHSANAEKWFSIESSHPDFEKFRDMAKTIIFAIIYGAGSKKIAANLKCSVQEAKETIAKVEQELNLAEYKQLVATSCRQNGGILHDVMGRRLCVPEILSNDQDVYQSGFRKINNYLIQGSAGSIFKELQLRADTTPIMKDDFDFADVQECYTIGAPSVVVHDEAIYEIEETIAPRIADKLSQIYSATDLLCVPITCKFKVGKTWKSAK